MSESTTIIPKTYVGDGSTISINGNTISAVDIKTAEKMYLIERCLNTYVDESDILI